MTSITDPKEQAIEANLVSGEAKQPVVVTEGTTPELSKKDRQKALGECYTEATKTLRERHLAEFNKLRVEAAAERGIKWEPQPTAAEKAAAEVERLLADHPELAERYGINTEASEVAPA